MRACWCSAIYNPEPRVLEGTLASQRGVTKIFNFEVLQNHNKLDRRSWLLWLIAKTIHNDANILANNTSTLLWATLKKEFSPQKNLVTKYKEISIFFWCRYTAPSSVIFIVLIKKHYWCLGADMPLFCKQNFKHFCPQTSKMISKYSNIKHYWCMRADMPTAL